MGLFKGIVSSSVCRYTVCVFTIDEGVVNEDIRTGLLQDSIIFDSLLDDLANIACVIHTVSDSVAFKSSALFQFKGTEYVLVLKSKLPVSSGIPGLTSDILYANNVANPEDPK
jgi:hypothetical protein